MRSTTSFISLRVSAGAAVLLLSLCLGAGAQADSLAVVDPLPPGPYAVGCSNVAQDFSRVQPGESAQNYNGYSLLHWVTGGMSYWAVTDASPVDLSAFKEAYSVAK